MHDERLPTPEHPITHNQYGDVSRVHIDAVRDAVQEVQGVPLLTGPRQTGSYELPGGNIVEHRITGDGAKETYTKAGVPAPKSPDSVHPSYAQYLRKDSIKVEVGRPSLRMRLAAHLGRTVRKG